MYRFTEAPDQVGWRVIGAAAAAKRAYAIHVTYETTNS